MSYVSHTDLGHAPTSVLFYSTKVSNAFLVCLFEHIRGRKLYGATAFKLLLCLDTHELTDTEASSCPACFATRQAPLEEASASVREQIKKKQKQNISDILS